MFYISINILKCSVYIKLNCDQSFFSYSPVEEPKVVCYYTSWSVKRPGAGRFEPEYLDPFLCTHVIYAFGSMKDFLLAPADPSDLGDSRKPGMYERIIALKEKNPKLKVIFKRSSG